MREDEVPLVIDETQDNSHKRARITGPSIRRYIFVAIVVLYTLYLVLYDPFSRDYYKAETTEEKQAWDNLYRRSWQWRGCPKMDQMLIISHVGGRLGNLVWEYLSAWAVARRYNMWPVVTRNTMNELTKVFQDLSVNVLEDIAANCQGFSNLTKILEHGTRHAPSFKSLLQIIEEQPAREGNKVVMVSLPTYVVLTQEVVPYWRDLAKEMTILTSLREKAQNVLQAIANQTFLWTNTSEKIEFVGIHVRRTDYMNHIKAVYGPAKFAEERYFRKAMEWLKNKLKNTTLLFVVLSDDPTWCKEKLAAPDVFLPGTGDASLPGLDLSILAACNHTIFAYGTFALTGAMLAQGRYTILFDTQNGTHSKEMEFAPYLPGWHVLNELGQENDKSYPLTFVYG